MNEGTHEGRPKGARCAAITRGGKPCPAAPLPGRAHCWTHDPGSAEGRREAGRKGGRARSTAARARAAIPDGMSGEELAGWLSDLFRGVVSGRVEPRVGTAAATIARALLEVKATTEIERRLAELEERAGIASGRDSA